MKQHCVSNAGQISEGGEIKLHYHVSFYSHSHKLTNVYRSNKCH